MRGTFLTHCAHALSLVEKELLYEKETNGKWKKMPSGKDTDERRAEWNVKAKREKIFGVIISFSVVCFMFVAGKVFMKFQDSRYSSEETICYLDTSSPRN